MPKKVLMVAGPAAEKIMPLTADRSLREKLSRNGRTTIEEGFSWEKIACDVERFYSLL